MAKVTDPHCKPIVCCVRTRTRYTNAENLLAHLKHASATRSGTLYGIRLSPISCSATFPACDATRPCASAARATAGSLNRPSTEDRTDSGRDGRLCAAWDCVDADVAAAVAAVTPATGEEVAEEVAAGVDVTSAAGPAAADEEAGRAGAPFQYWACWWWPLAGES